MAKQMLEPECSQSDKQTRSCFIGEVQSIAAMKLLSPVDVDAIARPVLARWRISLEQDQFLGDQ